MLHLKQANEYLLFAQITFPSAAELQTAYDYVVSDWPGEIML